MALLKIILLLVFSVCFISVHSYEYVPVYMWETSKNFSPLPSLGHINQEFCRDILLDIINKQKCVVMFLEENLSPEDFASHDSAGNSVFYNLSKMKSEAHVNYYPFVENPVSAVKSIPGVKVTQKDITPEGLPGNTEINPGEVLIIDLNDAKENEDRSQLLSRHDSIIASVYKSLTCKDGNVLALFTSRHSSWVVPSELEGSSRKARHLLADENVKEKPFVIQTDHALIYVHEGLYFYDNEMENDTAAFYNISDFGEHTSKEDNETVTVIAAGNQGNITFSFAKISGYWYFTNVRVFLKDQIKTDKEFEADIVVAGVYAPLHFSYHCNNSVFYLNETYLQLPGLQMEPFTANKSERFSDAYDCIGFTTAPIWSGLFVTFILALIMTFGLCMIMDIKTMDRFDDPKGKTISINVVE